MQRHLGEGVSWVGCVDARCWPGEEAGVEWGPGQCVSITGGGAQASACTPGRVWAGVVWCTGVRAWGGGRAGGAGEGENKL